MRIQQQFTAAKCGSNSSCRTPLLPSLPPPGIAFKHLVQRAIHRPLVWFPITSTFFSFICRFFFPILQFPVLGLNYILCRFPAFDFWTETQGSTRNHQPDLVRASPRWQTLLRSLSFLWFLWSHTYSLLDQIIPQVAMFLRSTGLHSIFLYAHTHTQMCPVRYKRNVH